MSSYFYDLHIHSCLSPCGNDDMTPPNLVNMAAIKGLQIIALTDHNSARNVRAAAEAAQGLPLVLVPGIELTTAEEIHIVCLFPSVEAAEAAGRATEAALPAIDNAENIFGRQEIRAADETLTGTVQKLLINATSIPVDDVQSFVARFGGFAYPAHIDKQSNSILAAFGYLPDHLDFAAVEVARPERFAQNPIAGAILPRYRTVTCSDAHQLELISEAQRSIELPSCDFEGLRAVLAPR